MLELEGSDWIEKDHIKTRNLEYRVRDFYGPFVMFYLEQSESGRLRVVPVSLRVETAEVSESEFSLLSKAAKELYEEFGEFALKTKLFEVKIDSEKTEELLLDKLKNIDLF